MDIKIVADEGWNYEVARTWKFQFGEIQGPYEFTIDRVVATQDTSIKSLIIFKEE